MLQSRFRFNGSHFMVLFLAGMSGFLFFLLYTSAKQNTNIGILIFWMVITGFLVSNLLDVLKVPVLYLTREQIRLKNKFRVKVIEWKDVTGINVSGSKNIASTTTPEEIAELTLKTGEIIFLRIDFYANGDEIRQFLNNIAQNGKSDLAAEKTKSSNRSPVLRQATFMGKPWINFRIWTYLGFVIFLWIKTAGTFHLYPERLPILIIPVAAFYWAFGTQLYYFLFSDNQLIVRNYFFFWKRKVYLLSELREVEITTFFRTATALRVITDSFSSKGYPASCLSGKDWKELETLLHELRIPFRNEKNRT